MTRPGPRARGWPSVVAVVPARDEAAILPVTLPGLLAQDYPGEFSVVLVDDASTDGTARRRGGAAGGRGPRARGSCAAGALPPGWAGKVHAMAQGVRAAGDVRLHAVHRRGHRLRAGHAGRAGPRRRRRRPGAGLPDGPAARGVPAGSGSSSRRSSTSSPSCTRSAGSTGRRRGPPRPRAAACWSAGTSLAAAGGLDPIRGARIDDVALGRLLKRPPSAARIWLGFTTGVRSLRPYPRLADLWDMVARSAYTQLRYSPALLAADPGRAAVAVRAAAGGRRGRAGQARRPAAGPRRAGARRPGWPGGLRWPASFLPVLRLYRLGLVARPRAAARRRCSTP